MRRSPLRIAATLALAVAVVTCSDSASSPRATPGGRAQISIAPRLSDEAASILRELRALAFDVTSVRVVITRPPSTVLKDTVVAFAAGASEVSIVLEVALNAVQEELIARVDLLDGITTLFSGTQTIVARQGQTTEAPEAVTLVYVGPGANARRVEIQPPTPTLILGRQQQLTAAAFDVGNAPVSGLPVNWSTSNASIATVSGTGLVQTAGTTGTATITARSANGLLATTTVLVIGPPTSLEVELGELSGVVGTTVAQPMTVRVLTSDEKPVPGVTVAFSAVTPGGSVTTATAVTDANGRASTTLTLGSIVGKYVFSASVVEFPAVPTKTTEVTASPAAPGSIRIVSGNGQTANGALPVPQPLVVEVRDALGNSVPNATVRWTRLTGTGALPSASTTTDANGRASTSYVLGNVAGTETIQADLPSVAGASVTFTITVIPSVASITKTSGDGQTAIVAQILPTPLTVVVRTPSGALATNTPVDFAVADTGSGWLAYSDFLARTVTAQTDDAGTATVRWQLGTPVGTQHVTATALGVSTTFTATALAGAASRLVIIQQPPTSISANTVFAPQPKVQVVDQYLNPVRSSGFSLYVSSQCIGASCDVGVPVDTASRGVFGTIPVAADANGLFTFTDLFINDPVGSYQLSFVDATERLGTAQSITFSLLRGPAASIEQSIPETEYTSTARGGGLVDFTPRVRVTDRLGYPVAGVTVTWGNAPGTSGSQGTIGNTNTVTDANGYASAGTWSLPLAPGGYSIAATVNGGPLNGQQVLFTATTLSVATSLSISGDNQSGAFSGSVLAKPLVVVVRDQAGNPMPNAFVSWVTAGGDKLGSGSLRTFDSFTNASGTAQATYVFPSDTAGRTYRIVVTADGSGGPTATFFAVLPPAGTAKRWVGGTKGAEQRWDVATNWEAPGGGVVSPPADENVFIPNVFTWASPVVSSAASSGTLYIETSANVTIASGATLTSSGDVMAFGDIRGPGTLAMVGTRRIRGTVAGGIQLFSQVTMAGNLFVGGDVIIVDSKARLTAANPFGGTGISLHVSGRLDNHGSLQIGDATAPLPDPSPMADISLNVLNLFAGSDITISELGTGRTVQLEMKSCHKSPSARITESKFGPVLGGCSTDLP